MPQATCPTGYSAITGNDDNIGGLCLTAAHFLSKTYNDQASSQDATAKCLYHPATTPVVQLSKDPLSSNQQLVCTKRLHGCATGSARIWTSTSSLAWTYVRVPQGGVLLTHDVGWASASLDACKAMCANGTWAACKGFARLVTAADDVAANCSWTSSFDGMNYDAQLAARKLALFARVDGTAGNAWLQETIGASTNVKVPPPCAIAPLYGAYDTVCSADHASGAPSGGDNPKPAAAGSFNITGKEGISQLVDEALSVAKCKALCEDGTWLGCKGFSFDSSNSKCASSRKPASCSVRRALLTPLSNPESLYRCGKSA